MITCTFQNGNKNSLRHAVTTCILLNDKNQVLLGKRALNITEGGKYGLIGGFMERDESVPDSLQREIEEETGYTATIDYLFYISDRLNIPSSDWQNIAFVFVAHVGDKVGEPDEESTELKWFDLDELPPKEELAFDHWDRIELYKKHIQTPFRTPFFRSQLKI
jgi:ADP-ribose pyrophosphatase YjhB (NUDIX family)